ncbi:ATP-binding protein [Actinokineospora terrae]|uniref:Sensor-like histidine kinase SenX3 n=1 Tax=Actinokineospora terrae TaxID=155974 RepID=A0A1H9WHN6_9PSEU|nr:ATP-binding protein [Actinokineospora terrae]SES33462.1 PAS fold-containing protein [Actinokineospora terrae]
MKVGTSLARTALFAVLYLVASVAGRLTVMDSTNLSMVWPAAGVAVVWFCVQRDVTTLWVDASVLAAVTIAVNMSTGASLGLAVVAVAANLIQAGVFVAVLARWNPDLWSPRSTVGPRDLWGLLGAAALATLSGVAVGPTALWFVTGHYSWMAAAVWLARNTAGILLVGALGLFVGRAVSAPGWVAAARARFARTSPWRVGEYLAVAAGSLAAYLVVFAVNHTLPLAFSLITLTVWAANRLPTTFVVVHNFAVGTIAVVSTLQGEGPFASVGSHAAKALIVQLFITLVAVVGLALALGRDERVALLRELAASQQEATSRAELMAAIIDSMGDGLTVVDADGRVTLRNPAATRLIGGRISPDDTVRDSEHYGLFHLDGTPIAAEDMPYARVLAGHDVHEMDILVRNDGVPGGRIISVNATTLPDGHGHGSAVVLFHDVTAERRHRDELATFAGVVAHDLLSPLTVVQCWTDAASQSLDAVPAHPALDRAQAGLGRVTRAATLMRGLISDLLAYTTARDAVVAPVAVDLTALVDDITATRIDTALATGAAVPEFYVEPLEPVHADLVLVRQLLDNLIGNAIKYTAPGITPRLHLAATRRGDTVRVTLTDNGIGIPTGQHDAIFDNFHRAHHTADYTGTGLGLAICKRIVERHGGTITATDNPAGGSRFTFTLPAVGTTRRPTDRAVLTAAQQ